MMAAAKFAKLLKNKLLVALIFDSWPVVRNFSCVWFDYSSEEKLSATRLHESEPKSVKYESGTTLDGRSSGPLPQLITAKQHQAPRLQPASRVYLYPSCVRSLRMLYAPRYWCVTVPAGAAAFEKQPSGLRDTIWQRDPTLRGSRNGNAEPGMIQ